MLARNFLTAAQLDIPQHYYDALVKTLGFFERGEAVHVRLEHNPENIMSLPPKANYFNMSLWDGEFENCRTVCCIGGFAQKLGNVRNLLDYTRTRFYMGNTALHRLFYPQHMDMDLITLESATNALRDYLTTGEPNWH